MTQSLAWLIDHCSHHFFPMDSFINLPKILASHAKWLADKATGNRADLSRADLSGTDLSRANLSRADLSRTDLSRADLSGADLSWADLSRTDLSRADLSWADLSWADLSGADLVGAVGLAIASDAPERLQAAAAAALADNGLDMSRWHTCDTKHCISGWAIHQAGELGRLLEAAVGAEVAGLMLLGPAAQRHFHDENEAAAEWLRSVLVPAA
jgi:hypothetical protein